MSDWIIPAPRQKVWQVLTATPFSWAAWWPELTKLQTLHVSNTTIGTRFTCVWLASGYRLFCDFTVTAATAPSHISFAATGDLAGLAEWQFTQVGDNTQIHIVWDVVTTKWWMNLFGFVLKPIFNHNHNRLMASGQHGLVTFVRT